MPQFALITATLVPTIIVLVYIVFTSDITIKIAPIIIVNYVYVPPISKGKATIVEDVVDLSLFTFEIRYSSHPILSHS